MKIKQLLFAALVAFTFSATAQSYNFSSSTGTYADLVGSTSLNNGLTWDDPQFLIPLGFDFTLFDTTVNQLYIEDYGFGGSLSTGIDITGVRPTLIVHGSDLIDRAYDFSVDEPTTGSESNISYLLEGSAGSQILKIEWNNVGFYEDLETGTSVDFTNFQLWLYEGSNDIEFHFGNNSITQPDLVYFGEAGTFAGLIDQFSYTLDSILGSAQLLAGDPTAPTTMQITSFQDIPFLDGTIPSGTIYKFSPIVSNLFETPEVVDNIRLFPNPATDQFSLAFGGDVQRVSSISILDTNGQVIRTIDQVSTSVDVSDLSIGTYFVRVESSAGVSHKKLIVD